MSVTPTEPQGISKGRQYSLPKVYLVMKPMPDGSMKAEFEYLPDPNRTYGIQTDSFFAKHESEIKVTEQGFLETVIWKPDGTMLASEVLTQAKTQAVNAIKAEQAAEKAAEDAKEQQRTAIRNAAAKVLGDAEARVDTARSTHDSAKNSVQALEDQIEDEHRKLDRKQAEADELEAEETSLEEELNGLDPDSEDDQVRIQQIESRLSTIDSEQDRIQDDILDIEDTLFTKIRDLERKKEALAAAERELSEAEAQAASARQYFTFGLTPDSILGRGFGNFLANPPSFLPGGQLGINSETPLVEYMDYDEEVALVLDESPNRDEGAGAQLVVTDVVITPPPHEDVVVADDFEEQLEPVVPETEDAPPVNRGGDSPRIPGSGSSSSEFESAYAPVMFEIAEGYDPFDLHVPAELKETVVRLRPIPMSGQDTIQPQFDFNLIPTKRFAARAPRWYISGTHVFQRHSQSATYLDAAHAVDAAKADVDIAVAKGDEKATKVAIAKLEKARIDMTRQEIASDNNRIKVTLTATGQVTAISKKGSKAPRVISPKTDGVIFSLTNQQGTTAEVVLPYDPDIVPGRYTIEFDYFYRDPYGKLRKAEPSANIEIEIE